MKKNSSQKTGNWSLSALQGGIGVDALRLSRGEPEEISVVLQRDGLGGYVEAMEAFEGVEMGHKVLGQAEATQVGRSFMFVQNAADRTNHKAAMYIGVDLLSEKLGSGKILFELAGKCMQKMTLSVPYVVVEAHSETSPTR